MKTEVISVTPEIAKDLLSRNNGNRKLTDQHCNFLANQMKNYQWQFDGQPIRISKEGLLLDGQHRLNAVVRSGRTIDFLVVSGINKDAFKVMDTGKNRSSSDCLSSMGIKYHSDIAACARFIINFNRGVDNAGGWNKVTNTEVIDWYDSNNHIVELIKKSEKLSKSFSNILSRSYVACLFHLLSKNNLDMSNADFFIESLCMGLDLELDNPIYILRKKLIDDKMSVAKFKPKDKLAFIIKSWNCYKKGSRMRYIRWNKSEPFPSIL